MEYTYSLRLLFTATAEHIYNTPFPAYLSRKRLL